MIKIYFLDRVLFIKGKDEPFPNIDSDYMLYNNRDELSGFILDFERDTQYKSAFIETENIEQTLNNICKVFTCIEAAGGVIYDTNNRILIIKRLGKYDLPKGKIEKGESVEMAALREIEEECGIKKLKIVNALQATFHTYRQNDEFIVKKTFWFNVKYAGNEIPVPQIEEDITDAFWIEKPQLPEIMTNTYSSIIDVFRD